MSSKEDFIFVWTENDLYLVANKQRTQIAIPWPDVWELAGTMVQEAGRHEDAVDGFPLEDN